MEFLVRATDVTARARHVRFTPDSGHFPDELACPFVPLADIVVVVDAPVSAAHHRDLLVVRNGWTSLAFSLARQESRRSCSRRGFGPTDSSSQV